ncbi:PIG-L deacetylase family protein [Arthrobacter sp. JZ12]|uniref:PIG-L deacetylase family protein n=1 Tax=Arthrobacter sp. JZ12 TaxID=2654190 RepID=UPI002B46EC20|nr:PIG-L family deacetylase [Arthrobacter sp. JZ12]
MASSAARTLMLVVAHPDDDAYGLAGTVALHAADPRRHDWLDYDDGAVADVAFDELVARLAAIMREEVPDVVATFGPGGITGHPNHIAIGLGPWDPTRVYHMRSAGRDDRSGGRYFSVAHRIVAGLKEHRSQRHVIYELDRSDQQWERTVSRESMMIAWPPTKPRATLLTDVLEGL